MPKACYRPQVYLDGPLVQTGGPLFVPGPAGALSNACPLTAKALKRAT